MKQGRKFLLALIWGAALVGVLFLLLEKGIKSDVVIAAWLTAFVAIPVQFGVTNVISKTKANDAKRIENGKNMGVPS
ncbi:hypothetical protein ES703_52854 [subsurface metagenome]